VDFPMRLMLSDRWFWLVFLFIPPLLTMRLFAEERSTGTLEMLLTAPLREWQIVLSKFVACFGFYLLMWVPTLVYLPVLLDLQVNGDQVMEWRTSTLLFVGGAGGVILSLILAILPSAFLRWTALLLFVAGGAAAGVGGWMMNQDYPDGIIHANIDPWPV